MTNSRTVRALQAAAGIIALAAGWSGGSMSNPGLPSVPPPPHLTPRAVNAGVLGALARVDNGHRGPTLKTFVDMAVGLTG